MSFMHVSLNTALNLEIRENSWPGYSLLHQQFSIIVCVQTEKYNQHKMSHQVNCILMGVILNVALRELRHPRDILRQQPRFRDLIHYALHFFMPVSIKFGENLTSSKEKCV